MDAKTHFFGRHFAKVQDTFYTHIIRALNFVKNCPWTKLFVSVPGNDIKLYKVSKAVDALNSEPVKCKFMLWMVKTVCFQNKIAAYCLLPIFHTHGTWLSNIFVFSTSKFWLFAGSSIGTNMGTYCKCLLHGNWTLQYHRGKHYFVSFIEFRWNSPIYTLNEMLWFAFVDKFWQIGHNLCIFVAFW